MSSIALAMGSGWMGIYMLVLASSNYLAPSDRRLHEREHRLAVGAALVCPAAGPELHPARVSE